MKEGNYSLEYMRNLRSTVEHNQWLGTRPDVMAGIKKFGIILNVNTGGDEELIFNIEIEFPIFEQVGIKGVVFTDLGNAFCGGSICSPEEFF